MKNTLNHICKYILFATNLAAFYSCSTNPMLSENIKISYPEKENLVKEIDRQSNRITYKTNLNNFIYPSERDLVSEANIQNQSLYFQNVKVVSDWITKNLSLKQKRQLSQNCEFFVGHFEYKFPLNARTIACVPWWIEKINIRQAKERKENSYTERDSVRMNENQKKEWLNFQNLNINQSLSLINLESPALQEMYVKSAIKYGRNCSLKNANAALILKLENFLPNPQAYDAIEEVYEKMKSCLKPNEEPSEKIHLRVGILRLLHGNIKMAQTAIEKTQQEQEPKDNSRNLFWLGVIYKKLHPKDRLNHYWEKLIKENPLALSSVVAQQQLGIDPMSQLISDNYISLQNRVVGGWTKENLETFIFDVLLARKKRDAANTWANYVTKNLDSINPDLILYWSLTQNKLHNYSRSIQMFYRYTRFQKNAFISPGLLNLQFPRAYIQEILAAKSNVDPILIISLMRQESAFDENARSGANARGLMQLLPSTAKTIKHRVNPNELYDADTNIQLGTLLLEKLFQKYNGKTEYVLASYNAGSSNLDKWTLRVPLDNMMLFCDFIPYRETRNYISIILRNYYWYYKLFSAGDDAFSKKMMKQSLVSYYKPDRLQALLSAGYSDVKMSKNQINLLNDIFIFGQDKFLNATNLWH